MKNEHTFESLCGLPPVHLNATACTIPYLSSTPLRLWALRTHSVTIQEVIAKAYVTTSTYGKKSISVTLPLQYLGEPCGLELDGNVAYTNATLFGVTLRATKNDSRGGLELYASVHVQSSPRSQTFRIFKDYSAALTRDTSVKRVTDSALQRFWFANVTAATPKALLDAIEAHYSHVGVA